MGKIKRFAITMLMGLTACTLAIGLSACNTIKKGEREWQESVPESSVEDSSIMDSTSSEAVHTHEFSDWQVKEEATCEEDGLEIRTCIGFGCEEEQTQTIPATGHQEVSAEAVEPTCTTEGKTEGSYCFNCEEIFVAQETIPALGHDEDCENSKSVLATCKTKAYCGVCESEYGEVLGHEPDIVVIEAKYPTCTEGGWDKYEMCRLCTYTTKVEFVALGHEPKAVSRLEPTCTEEGYIKTSICLRCEVVLNGTEVLPALGHDVNCTDEQSKAATCTGRAYCGICDSEYGLPLGHDVNCVNGKSNPATCISRAYCGVCEKEYGETLKHKIVWMPANPATCLEEGWDMYQQCTSGECGINSKVIIPALGHLSKIIEAIEPTCTEVGYTEGAQCGRCNILLTNPKVVAPLGHDVDCVNENSYIADCTRRAYCGVCESEYGDAPIYGVHTYITIDAKLPTHEETGWKEYQVCKYCYYSTYTDETALEKVPHEPKYYEAKEPTCTEAGYEGGWVCLVCEDFTVIPALGHDGCRYGQEPIHPDTVVPSCGEQGYCGICGEYGELPEGHTPRKAATCTTKAVCKVCGEEYGEPNGHLYYETYGFCLICGEPKVDLYVNKEND